ELGSDYFHFDSIHHALIGERSGKTWRLADRLTVKVARVDLEQTKIDFVLADEGMPKAVARQGPAKRKRAKSRCARVRARAHAASVSTPRRSTPCPPPTRSRSSTW